MHACLLRVASVFMCNSLFMIIPKEKIAIFLQSLLACALCCISNGCAKSNDQKKAFIENNQAKTNAKVSKKYGELVIPDFVKNSKYEFDSN